MIKHYIPLTKKEQKEVHKLLNKPIPKSDIIKSDKFFIDPIYGVEQDKIPINFMFVNGNFEASIEILEDMRAVLCLKDVNSYKQYVKIGFINFDDLVKGLKILYSNNNITLDKDTQLQFGELLINIPQKPKKEVLRSTGTAAFITASLCILSYLLTKKNRQ